ncbi:MAG: 30S ribosomal protein S16 [Streptosporangiaceae bacterium]
MAVKIKLKRLGKIREPHYRIIVADSRTKRDGRPIEEIGTYHPKEQPSLVEVNSDRAQYWLSVGAQPTDPVRALLRLTGDWQKFKDEPAPEHALQVKEPGPDKKAIFEAAAREAMAESEGTSSGGRGSRSKKSAKTDRADKTDKTEGTSEGRVERAATGESEG